MSALLTDISPALSPFRPILSRISPRDSPSPCWIKFSSSSRLPPRRARGCRLTDALPRCLTDLCRLIGLKSRELAIYCIEPALQLFLPIEDLLALGAEPVPLSSNVFGEVAVSEAATLVNVGHSYLIAL